MGAIRIGAVALAMAAELHAQGAGTVLAGRVQSGPDAPVPGANVFVLETLEGGLTGHAGRFSFTVARAGPVTVVVRRIGFVELRRAVTLPLTDSLVLELVPQAVELDPLTVEAGRVLAPADEPDVALTSLGVVTTPGTAADVYRAIQTFPGLQAVDEGAGLFVRGGDVAETRIYLNDALVLSPYRYESPTGGFFGAFDPFLLDGIAFSTGGFGARYGDALSAVADLETQGRPEALSGGATASLAAVSATMGLPLPSGLGARGTGTRSNTRLMFDVNGSTTEFSQVPEGRDLSGSLHWRYPGGEVKAFGMDQWSRVGVTVDDEAFSGTFNGEEVHRFSVITWRDTVSSAITSLSASVAYSGRSQSFGAFQLEERKRAAQLRGRAAVPLGNPFRLTAGGELEARRSSFAGSVPESADDNRPTARRTLFDAAVDGARHAEFVEGDWLRGATRVTGGLRTDWSELTGRRSWDPRLAGAWRVAPGATLTAAWGIYHQVPDPFFYEPTTGTPNLGPMRATHWVGGIQVEGLGLLLRGEGYVKTYRNLAQRTRDFGVVAGGQGVSRGMDWFLRWQGRPGLDLRLAYSLIHARRTDPDAGVQARSPFDISQVFTGVVDRTFAGRWRVAASYRSATGRPFTPVVSATLDSARGVWVPAYGAPMSQRVPPFRRVDLAGSYLHSFWPGSLSVFFVGVTNLLDRENVYGYRYSADYAERTPVRSQFKRSVYFGTSLTF